MTPQKYERLSELFVQGSELSLHERASFLDRCGMSDPELHEELARLFALDHPSGLSAPDESESNSNGAAAPAAPAHPRIPGYRIGELLGEGGMAQVWCAFQESTQRDVALKLIHGIRFSSSKTRSRFEREVELSARLAHPNIARVYDSGVAEGYAYYAMELVRGKSLDAYAADARLSERQKVELMLQVCRAVQHAHQRGVIHRDLKPSNVLVTDEGRPMLVDFGLAKSLAGHDAEPHLLTQRIIIGTPAYMSPEQAAGQPAEVDTRSDVYSLGVMLYRLLTERFPHDTSGDAVSAVRRVATDEIIPPRSVRPNMDRGLAAILVKALSRIPRDRYGTAGELADDIERHLGGDPVIAHAVGTLYVVRRLLRKHWKTAAAAGLLFVILTGGATAFVAMADRHARVAQELASSAEERRQAAVAAEREARQLAYVHQLEVANSEIAKHSFPRALALLDECPPGYRGWEWRLLKNRAAPRDGSYARIGPFDNSVRYIAFAPDGKQLAVAMGHSTAVATDDPVIVVCDSETGEVLTELRGHKDGIFALTFTPDGRQILSGGRDQSLRRWDARTGELLETVAPTPAGRMLFCVQFSANGQRVAFASHPQGLFLAEVPESLSWTSILAAAQHVYRIAGEDDCIAFSPDGARLAWTTRVWQGDVGHLFVVDAQSGEVIAHQVRPGGNPPSCVDYNPIGTRLITADRRSTVTMYSGELSEELGTFTRNEGSVRRAFYAADGKSIVGLVPGGMARVWKEGSRDIERVLFPAYDPQTMDMAISRDRRRLAIATGKPVVVRLWDLADERADDMTLAVHAPKARDVAISPDGRYVATCGDDGTVQLHHWPQRSLGRSITGELPHATAVAFSPDSRLLAIGCSIHPNLKLESPYGQITIVGVQTGEPVRPPLEAPGWIWGITFDKTGRKLVVADGVTDEKLPQQSGSAHVVDWMTGEFLRSVRVKDPRCRRAALTPSGEILIAASERTLSSWDVASGEMLAEDRITDGRNFVRLLENGTRLMTGNGTTIEVRDLKSFEVLHTFHQRRDMTPGVRAMVGDVALHPSGRTLVSGSWNGTLTVWDIETHQALLTIDAHPTGVHSLAFSPDGGTLFSAGHDGKVRHWFAD